MSGVLPNQGLCSYVPVKLSHLTISEIEVHLSNGDAKPSHSCHSFFIYSFENSVSFAFFVVLHSFRQILSCFRPVMMEQCNFEYIICTQNLFRFKTACN